MSAAELYEDTAADEVKQQYYDRRSGLSEQDYKARLTTSTTLYVGNLFPYTQESQLMELFSSAGPVKNLHMGLNSKTFKPCGFCFVEFQTRKHAEIAVECLNLASLDQNQVRLDWDYGFA